MKHFILLVLLLTTNLVDSPNYAAKKQKPLADAEDSIRNNIRQIDSLHREININQRLLKERGIINEDLQ